MYRRLATLILWLAYVFQLGSFAQPLSAEADMIKVSKQPGGLQVTFVDRFNGWVYSRLALWQTQDGSKLWKGVPIPVSKEKPEKELPIPSSLLSVKFKSSTAGWISIESVTRSGNLLTVYRSGNGGRTWKEQRRPPFAGKGAQYSQFYLDGELSGWEGGNQPIDAMFSPSGVAICKPSWDGHQMKPVVYHTKDGGDHWIQQVLPESRGCKVEIVVFRNSQGGVAVAEHNAYYTDDGGEHWHLSDFLPCCTDIDWNSTYSLPPTAVVFVGNTGWLSYEDGYLFKTLDGGRSWRQLAHPGTIWDHQNGRGLYGSMFFSNEEQGWILGGDQTIYKTMDGGITWSKLKSDSAIVSFSCADRHCWALSESDIYTWNISQ